MAYRPYYKKRGAKPSIGVTEELRYAGRLNGAGTRVCRVLIWPDDDGDLGVGNGTGPFIDGRGNVYQILENRYRTAEECLSFLDKMQKDKEKHFGRVKTTRSIEVRIKSWFKEFPYL